MLRFMYARKVAVMRRAFEVSAMKAYRIHIHSGQLRSNLVFQSAQPECLQYARACDRHAFENRRHGRAATSELYTPTHEAHQKHGARELPAYRL